MPTPRAEFAAALQTVCTTEANAATTTGFIRRVRKFTGVTYVQALHASLGHRSALPQAPGAWASGCQIIS